MKNTLWDQLDSPVLSLSTLGERPNMNICANLIHISTEPMMYGIPVLKTTRTFRNIQENTRVLLQLLADHQLDLIEPLGKNSGEVVDKLKDIPVEFYKELAYFPTCLSIMEMEVKNIVDVGDHSLAICERISTKDLNAGTPMTLSLLREKGLWE